MKQTPNTSSSSFIRDGVTWAAYMLLAYYAYMQAALGPLMPFLRAELGLNYTVAGLHLSAFALGMVLAGLTGDRLAGRYSRHHIFWLGGAGLAVGGLLFAWSQQVLFTLLSTLLMGWLGTFVLVMVQAILADHHGPRRAIALTESNLAASICAGAAPLMIGFFQRLGLGWRFALYSGVLLFGLLLLRYHAQPLPQANSSASAATRPANRSLPVAFWGYWLVIFLVVSIEWCVIFWGADFLETHVGLSRVDAATAMSLFFGAMILGRFTGSRLAHLLSGDTLLLLALAATIVGFPLFWLGNLPLLNLGGLFITGLGVANLFPFTLSVAVGVAPGLANTASARLSMGGGLAILLAPFVVGWIADQLGIKGAYGVVGVLLAIALLVTLATGHTARIRQRRLLHHK